MTKQRLLMIVVSIVLATANALTTCAQEVTENETSQTSTLSVLRVSEATDGIYNFKSFEIKAPEAGNYYTEFWLLPTKYANNNYTTFMVFVNNIYVGAINSTIGNWQSARVKGKETFELEKGVNVVTIATLAPEFPEVETIKVALHDSEATFSSDAYEEFLKDASLGVSYDIPEQNKIPTYATAVDIAHYSNVPLNYTFYKTFSFTKGQQIFITSSSSAQHKIDVVYYGSNPKLDSVINSVHQNIIKTALSSSIAQTDSSPIVIQPGVIPYVKFRTPYTPATSEEMQGLSYVFPSEKTQNSSIQVATARLTIPKTGQYLVRVRHAINGGSAIADVNINGAYYYENTPITLSYVDCSIPADGNTYATMTCCNNFGTDGPYLFIHGANCDRVVGFNDDGPSAKLAQYDLSAWDSYSL